MMAQLGLQEVPQIEDGEWVSTFDHRLAYFTTQSLTFVRNASWSLRKCSAASMFKGSSKLSRSEKREDRPHSTSRRRLKYPTKMTAVALSGKYNLVGAQPNPSTECGLRSDRHISPSSEILGCHNLKKTDTQIVGFLHSPHLVRHVTEGGRMLYSTGTQSAKLIQQVS